MADIEGDGTQNKKKKCRRHRRILVATETTLDPIFVDIGRRDDDFAVKPNRKREKERERENIGLVGMLSNVRPCLLGDADVTYQ